MSGPLKGIRIVEMVGLGPCPFAAMMLADMGAEVIRIDRKPTDGPTPYPMQGTCFDVMARGRRSLALDLKAPEARDLALHLIDQADGLIEGFRPGVMERLGLGPDVMMKYMPPGIVDYDHAEAVNALAQGQVAMITEWSAFYPTLTDP
ncbi:CoA transferase, partial [Caballeronia sp. M23-90]